MVERVVEVEKDDSYSDRQVLTHWDTSRMEQRGEQQSRESHPGGAFQVAGHDADPGVDL